MCLLKSLFSLKHHSPKSSSSTLPCHHCSPHSQRGKTWKLVTLTNTALLQWQLPTLKCLSCSTLTRHLSRASHKLWVPYYAPTICQLLLLIFGEGGELSSRLHNCHPVIHKSCSLLNRQIMTDQGRNLAATVDVTLMD